MQIANKMWLFVSHDLCDTYVLTTYAHTRYICRSGTEEDFDEYDKICTDLLADLAQYKEVTAKETAAKEEKKKKKHKADVATPGAEVLDEHLKAHHEGQNCVKIFSVQIQQVTITMSIKHPQWSVRLYKC